MNFWLKEDRSLVFSFFQSLKLSKSYLSYLGYLASWNEVRMILIHQITLENENFYTNYSQITIDQLQI